MPTNMIVENSYEPIDSVLATLGASPVRMLTVDPDSLSTQLLKAGTVMVRRGDGLGAPYKATKLAAAVATGTSLTVQDASLYVSGDVITVASPYARLDVAATWANGDAATVVLNGQEASHAVADFSTLTALATAIAATLSNSVLGKMATFIAENQYVHVFGNDIMTIAAAEATAGNGTLTVANAVTNLQLMQPVGTVAPNGVDVENNVLTLTGAIARRLPLGAPVSAMTASEFFWGLVTSDWHLEELGNDVPCYHDCTVFGARLPFWSGYLARQLPQVTLV